MEDIYTLLEEAWHLKTPTSPKQVVALVGGTKDVQDEIRKAFKIEIEKLLKTPGNSPHHPPPLSGGAQQTYLLQDIKKMALTLQFYH